jgi:hypothetical protein
MDIRQLCLQRLQTEEYRIPRFIVTDDAYVEVSEHKTSVMTAMAESSLSKNSSEVAMYVHGSRSSGIKIANLSRGDGAFGWSGGVTGGHEYESSERNQVRRNEETNHMIITYNVSPIYRDPSQIYRQLIKMYSSHASLLALTVIT